jgi:hypothetical protein
LLAAGASMIADRIMLTRSFLDNLVESEDMQL